MLPRGTRIEKCNSKDYEDGHKDGDRGTIMTAYPLPEESRSAEWIKRLAQDGHISEGCYFVEWDDMPNIPVAVADYRVKEIPRETGK